MQKAKDSVVGRHIEENTKEVTNVENLIVEQGIDIEVLRRVSPRAAFQLEIDMARENWQLPHFEFVGGRADRRSTTWRVNKEIMKGHVITLVDVFLILSNNESAPVANVRLRTPAMSVKVGIFNSKYEGQKYRAQWPSRSYTTGEGDAAETKYDDMVTFSHPWLRQAHEELAFEAVEKAIELYLATHGAKEEKSEGNNPLTD